MSSPENGLVDSGRGWDRTSDLPRVKPDPVSIFKGCPCLVCDSLRAIPGDQAVAVLRLLRVCTELDLAKNWQPPWGDGHAATNEALRASLSEEEK